MVDIADNVNSQPDRSMERGGFYRGTHSLPLEAFYASDVSRDRIPFRLRSVGRYRRSGLISVSIFGLSDADDDIHTYVQYVQHYASPYKKSHRSFSASNWDNLLDVSRYNYRRCQRASERVDANAIHRSPSERQKAVSVFHTHRTRSYTFRLSSSQTLSLDREILLSVRLEKFLPQ